MVSHNMPKRENTQHPSNVAIPAMKQSQLCVCRYFSKQKEFEDENSILKAELAAERAAHEETHRIMRKKELENEKLREENKVLRLLEIEHKAEIESLKKKLADLTSRYADLKAKNKELLDEIERLKQRICELEALLLELARIPSLEDEIAKLQGALENETALHKRVLNVHAMMRLECDEWEKTLKKRIGSNEESLEYKRLVETILDTLPRADFFKVSQDPHRASYLTVHRKCPGEDEHSTGPKSPRAHRDFVLKHDPSTHYTSRAGGWAAPIAILSTCSSEEVRPRDSRDKGFGSKSSSSDPMPEFPRNSEGQSNEYTPYISRTSQQGYLGRSQARMGSVSIDSRSPHSPQEGPFTSKGSPTSSLASSLSPVRGGVSSPIAIGRTQSPPLDSRDKSFGFKSPMIPVAYQANSPLQKTGRASPYAYIQKKK